MCVEFRDEILLRGEECKTPENSNFLKNDEMVISVKIQNFSRSWMINGLQRWNHLAKSSYHVEFRRNSETVGISCFSRHREWYETLGTL